MTKNRPLSPTTWSVLAAGIVLAVGALVAANPLQASEDADTLTVSRFHVEGMTCGGCEVGLRMAVGKLDGVDDVEASYKEGSAAVTYDVDKVTPDEIIAAIAKLGYTAELEGGDSEDGQDTGK